MQIEQSINWLGSISLGSWVYGFETWCNLEGQYTFIVMDLTNLSDDTYEMSLCTVGIMGTRYVRDGPENLEITIVRGDQGQIEIQRVYSEMEIATDLNINLRLKN